MKVYFTPKVPGPAHAVSPSAYKPAEVVASWLQIAPNLEVIEPGRWRGCKSVWRTISSRPAE